MTCSILRVFLRSADGGFVTHTRESLERRPAICIFVYLSTASATYFGRQVCMLCDRHPAHVHQSVCEAKLHFMHLYPSKIDTQTHTHTHVTHHPIGPFSLIDHRIIIFIILISSSYGDLVFVFICSTSHIFHTHICDQASSTVILSTYSGPQ